MTAFTLSAAMCDGSGADLPAPRGRLIAALQAQGCALAEADAQAVMVQGMTAPGEVGRFMLQGDGVGGRGEPDRWAGHAGGGHMRP